MAPRSVMNMIKRNVSVYTYDKDGREITTRMGTRIRTTEYDTLGRVKSQSWGLTSDPDAPAMGTSYTYPVVNTTHEGSLPDSMTTPLGTYAYTYDANGNLTEIVFTDAQNTDVKRERYQYDERNQLIREDSESQGKTFVYHYDTGGNLTSVKEYGYTTGTPSQLLGTSTGTYQMQSMNASCEADCVHEGAGCPVDIRLAPTEAERRRSDSGRRALGVFRASALLLRGSVEGPDGGLDRWKHW